MKKIIALITLLMFSAVANAEISTSGLSKVQAAEIELQVQKLKESASSTTLPVQAKEVREWVEIGSAIGEGMAGAAGKLGIEVNKFADTFVGKFTMFVIAWHYMGQEIVSILFGACLLMFGIPTWLWMYRTRGARRIDSIREYDKGEGPNNVRKVIEYTTTSQEMKGWYLAVLAVILVLGTLTVIA